MKNWWSVYWRIVILQTVIALPLALLIRRSNPMDDVIWIKLKPSIYFILVALVLLLTKIRIQNGALSLIWGGKLNASTQFWQLANRVFVLLHITLGVGNFVAAYMLSIPDWIDYKIWVPSVGLIIVSAILGRQLRGSTNINRTS
jgi:intracellular septation protein A